jgi:molybdopterin-binding protein
MVDSGRFHRSWIVPEVDNGLVAESPADTVSAVCGDGACMGGCPSRGDVTGRVSREESFRTVGGNMTLSARNHLKGKIEEIQKGDVLVHVTVRVGDNQIESVITKRSADEMALKEGDSVTAVVKATEVMLSKP